MNLTEAIQFLAKVEAEAVTSGINPAEVQVLAGNKKIKTLTAILPPKTISITAHES